MFDTHRIQQDFSNAAADYDAHAALQQHVFRRLLGKMKPLMPAHSRVLDAGCGTGQLARTLNDCEMVQLDIAPAMCMHAVRPDAPALAATIAALPFASQTFDAVFSSLALQWLEDPAQALQEMQRVLKPGGILAVSSFAEGTLAELKESFAVVDAAEHVSHFTAKQEGWESETVTEYFADLQELMRHIKIIGARNKLTLRRKSLMTPGQLGRVEAHYRACFGTGRGLPVTWNILYGIMRTS